MDTENGPTEVAASTEPAASAAPVEVAEPVDGKPEWSPPQFEAETGIAIDGDGLPVNHRLRAERLSDAGDEQDPGGMIAPDLIADAGQRLEAQRAADDKALAAAEAANPPVNTNMTVAAIEKVAKRQGIDISTAANNDERVAMIEAARSSGMARPANEETV